VIRKIGLSCPFFIKWDDAEFSLRAEKIGCPTASFPTIFVWHDSWGKKDDTIDWQAFYHERNRLVVALLYSKKNMPLDFFLNSYRSLIAHLCSYHYSVCQQYIDAIHNVFEGPDAFRNDLPDRLPKIQNLRKTFVDSVVKPVSDFPESKRVILKHHNLDKKSILMAYATGFLHQFLPVKKGAKNVPEHYFAPSVVTLNRVINLDSAVVAQGDGDMGSYLLRDRSQFKYYLKELVKLHIKLMREWKTLSKEYRKAHKAFASKEAWEEFFFAKHGVEKS
jgi:galactofuranosylgalactofuranosylrhamnosyl-N-acetylglucosaminyl-diphospho-decaprenol beta-1,5/1,6-galactofuranosyltransferase